MYVRPVLEYNSVMQFPQPRPQPHLRNCGVHPPSPSLPFFLFSHPQLSDNLPQLPSSMPKSQISKNSQITWIHELCTLEANYKSQCWPKLWYCWTPNLNFWGCRTPTVAVPLPSAGTRHQKLKRVQWHYTKWWLANVLHSERLRRLHMCNLELRRLHFDRHVLTHYFRTCQCNVHPISWS